MRKRANTRHFLLLFFVLVLNILCQSAEGQAIKVRGGFLTDSVKIGEQTAFYLSAKYPSELNILFPDSTHGFNPFEYQSRKYFSTETIDSISTDSTVYYLTTFEIDSVQYLELPVYIVNEQDCTTYTSNRDSLLLTQLVGSIPDSITIQKLPLLSNVNYHEVPRQFNFVVLGIILAALLVILVIVWIFFGKKIMRYFQAKRLQKRHAVFVERYTTFINQIRNAFSPTTTESAYSLWKQYMEDLESKPYTKLTTREMLRLQPDESIGGHLRNIDRAIYGHDTSVLESLDDLKKIADQRFQKKIEEVKHGK